MRQLCRDRVEAALLVVVGTDTARDLVLGDAAGSGLDIDDVVRRGRTALLVDLINSRNVTLPLRPTCSDRPTS